MLCYLVGSMGESHVEVFATGVKIEGVIKVLLEPIINFEGNDEAMIFHPSILILVTNTCNSDYPFRKVLQR